MSLAPQSSIIKLSDTLCAVPDGRNAPCTIEWCRSEGVDTITKVTLINWAITECGFDKKDATPLWEGALPEPRHPWPVDPSMATDISPLYAAGKVVIL